MGLTASAVIAGLDPAIHPSSEILLMDARVKPAHDEINENVMLLSSTLQAGSAVYFRVWKREENL